MFFLPHTEPKEGMTLERLIEDYGMSSDQLDSEIEERDLIILAGYFDDVKYYVSVLGLSESEKVDVQKAIKQSASCG